MKLTFTSVCILTLYLTSLCYAYPVEQTLVEIVEPQKDIILLEIDKIQPDTSLKIRPRQEDGDGADAAEGLGAQAIGNNVIKVVTSALTGNVNGIFDGSFNLFGTGSTRNQVEGFFQSFVGGLVNSIVGPSTTPNPNAVAASGSSGGSSGGGGGGASVASATTPKGAQYVILLNQSGGEIKGASIISPQTSVVTSKPKPAAAATTKKTEEDDDEEENEENSGRRSSS